MVRFSCFQSRVHSHKQKKRTHLPAEAMQKRLEDTSQNWAQKNLCCPAESKSLLIDEAETLSNGANHTDISSLSDRDCRSEDMESKYITGYDLEAYKNAPIEKNQSFGSGLNLKEWNSGGDESECEIEKKFSYNGSADSGRIVISDGINDNVHDMSEKFQEPMPSDSARNSDCTKNESIISVEESLQLEREGADKDNLHLSVVGDTVDHMPHTSHAIVKSRSLPGMISPTRGFTSVLPGSRSAGDLNALDSGMNSIFGV